MLTEEEAQALMIKLIDLRTQVKETNDSALKHQLNKHERICIEKFKYLVIMKTSRYKSFNNYQDLNQEGFEALIKAMKNYNPKKGSFFWWAHKYIDTRISRSANLHTTIRYPLKVAKATTPHKEAVIPLLIEERFCPDKNVEEYQISNIIEQNINNLSNIEQQVINLAFGFNSKELSINKICKKLNISRANCIRYIDNALSKMKDNIQI